jgi:hypothetical protein
MDAKTTREITRLRMMDLHAQKHFARGREWGSMHWMIRGARLQMMANAKLEEIVMGGAGAPRDASGAS